MVSEHKFFQENTVCPTCTQSIENEFRLNKIVDIEEKSKELNDGYREFYSGEISFNGSLIWNGTAVAQGNTILTPNGYPDFRWNGYAYLGEDNIRRTFIDVNPLTFSIKNMI